MSSQTGVWERVVEWNWKLNWKLNWIVNWIVKLVPKQSADCNRAAVGRLQRGIGQRNSHSACFCKLLYENGLRLNLKLVPTLARVSFSDLCTTFLKSMPRDSGHVRSTSSFNNNNLSCCFAERTFKDGHNCAAFVPGELPEQFLSGKEHQMDAGYRRGHRV